MLDNLQSKKILTYDDSMHFPAGSSNEILTDVRTYDDTIISEYLKTDMLDITGEFIYLRDTLSRKLSDVNATLKKGGMVLKIAYGYRHPEVQTKYFENRRAILQSAQPDLNDEQLDRLTHNFVAVPSIGGHPAAAAIDLTIVNFETNKELDMGTGIADYRDPLLIQTYDERVTDSVMENRMILHDAMVAEEFAPFYGEWWHFSYGDREWAAFYNKEALYGQIDFRTIGRQATRLS